MPLRHFLFSAQLSMTALRYFFLATVLCTVTLGVSPAFSQPADEAVAEARRLGAYSSRAYAQTKEVLRAGTLQRVLEGGEADLARFHREGEGDDDRNDDRQEEGRPKADALTRVDPGAAARGLVRVVPPRSSLPEG